jgi:hypothetical protein
VHEVVLADHIGEHADPRLEEAGHPAHLARRRADARLDHREVVAGLGREQGDRQAVEVVVVASRPQRPAVRGQHPAEQVSRRRLALAARHRGDAQATAASQVRSHHGGRQSSSGTAPDGDGNPPKCRMAAAQRVELPEQASPRNPFDRPGQRGA